MGQKHKNLFDKIVTLKNFWEAYRLTALGKKNSMEYLRYKEYDGKHIHDTIDRVVSGEYIPGEFNVFTVYDPKKRIVRALPFKDRIVQHAIHNVIGPIFEGVFLHGSYACRPKRGTHEGVKYVQAYLRKHPNSYYLKLDFKDYFNSIDRTILWKEIERKIRCPKTLDLLSRFHPKDGKGLPVGNLTSQLLANVYGHMLDRHLTHVLKVPFWCRYIDDTVILSDDREYLVNLQKELTKFIDSEMKLRWSRWSIAHNSKGINFLGYRIFIKYKLLRRRSVVGAKRKIRQYLQKDDKIKLKNFMGAWRGHLSFANSYNLRMKILGEPMKRIIQSRKDLDAIKGTQEYKDFLELLKGSMVVKRDMAQYPEDYDQNLKEGDDGFIPKDFQEVEDLSTIEKFGYNKEEFEDELRRRLG